MYRYKKKKGKKKERRRNFSQFSCPQCSYLSETVLKCTTHSPTCFLFCFSITIDATVNSVFGVSKFKNVVDILLGRGYASRVFAG